jgi:hypothetical protein
MLTKKRLRGIALLVDMIDGTHVRLRAVHVAAEIFWLAPSKVV